MPVEIAKSPNEKNDTLQPIIHLRKMLHRHPELSGQETGTAERIREFFTANHPTELITKIGGHGLAAVYNFSNEGPVVVVRCELDALPIAETNPFEHRSLVPGVSHKCGHDGHMAIVAVPSPKTHCRWRLSVPAHCRPGGLPKQGNNQTS